MTFTDHASGGARNSIFGSYGYRAPLAIVISIVLLVVIWLSPPMSFLSYSQLSSSQIENFLSSPVTYHYDGSSLPSTKSPAQRHSSVSALLPEEAVVEVENQDALAPSISQKSDGSNESLAISDDKQDEQLQGLTAADEEAKYIFPLLSFQVGTGNQLMEYKSAAVIARTLNRTLCLTPFFMGPGRHFGYLGDRHAGMYIEERYDTDVLSKLVKVASLEYCLKKCERKLDAHWRLRNTGRAPQWNSWFNDTPRVSMDFDRNSPQWSSTADVAETLGPRNEAKCVGLGGLFPGLRWRGVYFAGSAYFQHSKIIMHATELFQAKATGPEPFLSVHWRFEESNCAGHPLGLCFSRCADGAVIANAHKSERWASLPREGRKQQSRQGFNGVSVPMEDISGAISDRAKREGVNTVYVSSDGWLRGAESMDILRWVVNDLRSKNLVVAGLWQIPGLPNFSDGSYVHPETIAELFGLDRKEKVSNSMIALVEQEMCIRSAVFLGSGQSSWSIAVADTRRGRKCKLKLEEEFRAELKGKKSSPLDPQVIDAMLTILYGPGPTCRGSTNSVSQTDDEEAPDGWLDYESCEGRLDLGGRCSRIST